MGDPVVAVAGVAPVIAVEPVPHVNQFFGNHDFHGPWLILVDAFEVDQDDVVPGPDEIAVGPAVRRRDASPNPGPKRGPVGGNAQAVDRQMEQGDIVIQEFGQAVIALVEEQQWFDSA